jgi:SRSO17 transposase
MVGGNKMLSKENPYNAKIPPITELQKLSSDEIANQLRKYLENYRSCFVRSQQIRYFEAFEKGLLSNLDRKSIEPIALSFLGEKEVRGMQQFFTRSTGWEKAVGNCYKEQLAQHLTDHKGFLSVDESDFVKKGKDSAGVARQYCGRMGKRENCQAGVFLSYASEKGIGIIDSRLYLPEAWFGDDYKDRRQDCQIPEGICFKTKNEMAKEMMDEIIESQLFEIQCVGCDASFGSDHTFLDNLPESVYYFAAVRENENVFRERPDVYIPENTSGKGGRFKHPRSTEPPVNIKTIINDESIPWVKRTIAEGVKGPVTAEIKCLRLVSCRKENRLFVPKNEILAYIRKHEDGTVKYFLSNLPSDTSISELDTLATARWSIEQCFQECKGYLGMTHYETRSYQAWHRHMRLVMIAQLFVTILRNLIKKIRKHHNADGSLYYCFTDTDSHPVGRGFDDSPLSLAS